MKDWVLGAVKRGRGVRYGECGEKYVFMVCVVPRIRNIEKCKRCAEMRGLRGRVWDLERRHPKYGALFSSESSSTDERGGL